MRHTKDAHASAPRADARDNSASAAPSTRTRMPDFRTLRRRMKAAGFVREDADDTEPVDIDALRCRMARSIHMAINTWKGCTEPLCRRERGCMAPTGRCTNRPPSPEPSEDAIARTKAMFYRLLKEVVERKEAEEALQEADADLRPRATPRNTTPRKGAIKKKGSRGDDAR